MYQPPSPILLLYFPLTTPTYIIIKVPPLSKCQTRASLPNIHHDACFLSSIWPSPFPYIHLPSSHNVAPKVLPCTISQHFLLLVKSSLLLASKSIYDEMYLYYYYFYRSIPGRRIEKCSYIYRSDWGRTRSIWKGDWHVGAERHPSASYS